MNAFDSSRIESFLEFWQQKPNSPEGKLTEAYNLALKDFDNKQTGLLRHIRPQKASGKLIPVFSEGSEHLIADFEEAEKHLADARADIEAYLVLTEDQPSMSDLNDKLFRARRAITEATLDARRTLERALRKTNSSSMDEIEGRPEVQAAMDKRDQVQRQLGPVVEDLQGRINTHSFFEFCMRGTLTYCLNSLSYVLLCFTFSMDWYASVSFTTSESLIFGFHLWFSRKSL